ncbi:MAG: hypothetical protein ACRCZ9_08275 [Fusobacteriaceae bacterium]
MNDFLSIKNSEVFKFLDATADADSRIQSLLKNSREVNTEAGSSRIHNVDDVMGDNDVVLRKAISAWDRGEIKLLYAKDIALGNSVMFIPGPQCIRVNVTMFCKDEEIINDGNISYVYKFSSTSVLKEILCVAYVISEFARNSKKYVVRNFGLRKRLLEVYNLMFLNVLSRISGIAANKDNAPVVKYIMMKFIHNTVLGLASDEVDTLCQNLAEITTTDQRARVEGINIKYGDKIDSLEKTITILRETFVQLDKLDMTYLLKSFTFTFTAISVMTIDYIPYLGGLCESARHGFGIYQSRKIKTEIGKEALMAGMDIINAIDKG